MEEQTSTTRHHGQNATLRESERHDLYFPRPTAIIIEINNTRIAFQAKYWYHKDSLCKLARMCGTNIIYFEYISLVAEEILTCIFISTVRYGFHFMTSGWVVWFPLKHFAVVNELFPTIKHRLSLICIKSKILNFQVSTDKYFANVIKLSIVSVFFIANHRILTSDSQIKNIHTRYHRIHQPVAEVLAYLQVQISPISCNVVGSILLVLEKITDTAIVGYRWTGLGGHHALYC